MTLHHLTTWTDFDDDGEPLSATVLGQDGEPIAIVLAGNHHDDFKRLALAAPDMVDALTIALEAISAVPNYRVPGHTGGSYAIASLIEQALTKAKGE